MSKHFLTEEYLLSVADAVLVDEATGVQLATASLTTHNISQSVDITEIKAGQENATYVTLKNNKTITVELTDIQQNRQWFAMQTGADIEELGTPGGILNIEAYAFPKTYTMPPAQPGGQMHFDLDHTPIANQTIKIYKADTKEQIEQGLVTLNGDTLEVEAGAGLKENDLVVVEAYKYSLTQGDVIRLKSGKYGKSYRLILDEKVLDSDLEIVGRRQSIFYKVTPDDNFTLSGSTELSEQNQTYTFTVKKHPNYEDLGVIIYHNEKK